MKLNRLIIDNQSNVGYYELQNLDTNDYIIGNSISAYDFGLLCGKATTIKKLKGVDVNE